MPHEALLRQLFSVHFGTMPETISRLPQAGSDRIYFRLASGKHRAIGTYGKDTRENETFIHHARHFRNKGILVPEVYIASEDNTYYLQEDLGDTSLYSLIRREGITPEQETRLADVLRQLAHLQIKGAEGFNFAHCYPIQEFDRASMFWDLNSFKYYFARVARAHFNEAALNRDFHTLCEYLLREKNLYFMFRDCQSRNIMVKDGQNYFIDFQGGRKGALQYDAASLLWQAGARIPYAIREQLFDRYCEEVAQLIPIDKQDFKQRYYAFVLIRMLQVLGAYGFRGLIEKRAHFIESIIPALENVAWFLQHIQLEIQLPELYAVLRQLITSDLFKVAVYDGSNKPLVVDINSFSYKRGLPADSSGNGGGFIFDCRGLHNPGRYEAYKQMTGKDQPVIDFLESQSRVKEFLEHVWQTIDINVENYLERNFEHLQINFGCTGGQHRSVYCAEQTAQYLKNKYKVNVIVRHIERELQAASASHTSAS